MKTLTTFALLTALAVGTSAANAREVLQDRVYYRPGGAVGPVGAMCGTRSNNCCPPTCTPACPDDCSYTSCCPTYHQKCYWDSCTCSTKYACCRDVKGIFDGWRWFW